MPDDIDSPPWKRVSPVNITLPVLSSMNQQMLSCVWHGVYRALTAISPILKPSPFFGVRVTPSQSLPPMIGFPLNSEWANWLCMLVGPRDKGLKATHQFLVSTSMVPMTNSVRTPPCSSKLDILVCVDNCRQVYLSRTNLLLQNWCHPINDQFQPLVVYSDPLGLTRRGWRGQ